MNAGAVNVFHDAGNQNVFAVTNRVHFNFLPHQIFIDQNRMFRKVGNGAGDDAHKFVDVRVACGNLHTLTAQNITRAHQNGIAEAVRGGERLFGGEYRLPLRARDVAVFQNFVEAFAVFGGVDVVGVRAENGHAQIVERFCKFNGGLPAELDNRAVGLFHFDNVGDIFGGQRLEIQLVRNVEVGRNRFGVVVDDNRLTARLLERPNRVHRAVVKFDTLADADRSGTEHHDFFMFLFGGVDFVFHTVIGIVVWRLRRKFSRAGVNYGETRLNLPHFPKILDRRFRYADVLRNHVVGKAETFCFKQRVAVTAAGHQFLFHVDNYFDFL